MANRCILSAIFQRILLIEDFKKDISILLLIDFFELDMNTNQWTELKDFGLPYAVDHHSLTPIGPKQIMLLGGAEHWAGRGASNKVLLYDAEKSTWKESHKLPAEFCGVDGGLSSHKTVAVKKGDRVTKVICVGGYMRYLTLSTQLLEFKVAQLS